MKYILTSVLILVVLSVNAQIGKFLKDQLKENKGEIKSLLNKEAEKKRESLDSLDVIYAISFTDNSSLVNISQKNETLIKGANFIFDDENSGHTREEEIREQLMLGKRLYALNQFIPATITLHAAKLNYEDAGLIRDVNYFETISNLGLIYGSMSRYAKANEYTYEALDLRIKNLGKNSPAFVASLNNKAVLLKEQGKFNEAEQDLKTVIHLTKELHGEQSIHHAIALNNMAMLYQEVGRYKDAEEMMERAIKISGENESKRSRNHERFLTNMAILQQLSGNYEDAEKTYLHVKSLQERFFKDNNNPEFAHTLTNLASLYLTVGKYNEVEDLLKKASAIYEKKFGDEHPAYATAQSYLGNFYRGEERYDEAEAILTEVVDTRKMVLGTNHPDYNKAVEDLAVLYWKKKEYEKAIPLFTTVLDKSLDFITQYFPPLSESEKTSFWGKLNSGFENFYAFTSEAGDTHPGLIEKMFSYRMATKGLLMSSAGKLKQEILESNDEGLKATYSEWVDTKETIANAYGLSLEEQKEQEINIPALESKANTLEKELSAKSNVFKKIVTPDSWPLARLQKHLKTGEAAVEIISFHDVEGHDNPVKYAALIIKPAPQKPELVVLENGEQLEKRYFKYYHNAIQQKLDDAYSYNAFWKPVHEKLRNETKIYYSPDGVYNQLNPNTFRTDSKKFLADLYSISLLTTLREIENKLGGKKENNAVLLGFPAYGSTSVTPLPGTKEEIDQINKLLNARSYKVTKLDAQNATEGNVKKVNDLKVLHIATHGYFMEDSGSDLKGFGIESGTLNDNPMLRSGLILANVGLTMEQQQMQGLSSSDNGLLTAYEAINLNLENTELVVLSACETGLGEVKAGEGVYGLQRAFVVAGAETIIMSLWKVDDQATQLLMSNFYKEWLKGTDKLTAFKSAQKTLRQQYTHPYYWGAFVMVGN